MLEKLSHAQVNEYMAKAASALRSLKQENDSLKEKVASYERKSQAEKIASLAVQRGVLAEDDAAEYADSLASGGEDLKMVEDFVRRSSGGLSLGKTLEKTASAEESIPGSADVLTQFLLTSDLGV